MQGLRKGEVAAPQQGGYARTDVAKKNLELSRPWLEAIR